MKGEQLSGRPFTKNTLIKMMNKIVFCCFVIVTKTTCPLKIWFIASLDADLFTDLQNHKFYFEFQRLIFE